MDHLLSMKRLGPDGIIRILDRAAELRGGAVPEIGRTHYISNLFFEPSTRTKTSFEMAERRLGLEVIPFEAGFSSTLKGETLYDTVRTLEAIGLDALVIRHPEDRFYKELEGLKVTIAGDVSHSRVAKSGRDALEMFGADVRILCPPEWQGDFDSAEDWEDVLPDSDAVMLLRVQHERHSGEGSFSAGSYHERYGLTAERAERMKEGAIILHPAPVNRGVEIAGGLVEHSRSRIFRQVENGVYVRMAVLEMILKGRD